MYYLDLSDDGVWLIKNNSERFHAGFDKDKAQKLITRLNDANHPNVEERDSTLYVCWNLHEKGDKCDWEMEIRPTKRPPDAGDASR